MIKNQPSLEEWTALRERVNHEDGWQVVSTGMLDVSFEELAFLAKKSVFRNTGILMCAVDEQTTILDLPILDNVNTIQFYGVSNSPTPIFLKVKMDVWVNKGIIDFFSQGLFKSKFFAALTDHKVMVQRTKCRCGWTNPISIERDFW